MGGANAETHSIRRDGHRWADYPGWQSRPANGVVSGGDDPDAPWSAKQAPGLGSQNGAQARIETSAGRTFSTNWRRFAPHAE